MRYLFFSLLLLSFEGYGQCKEFIISVKGDTLNCVDLKGRKQGPWVVRIDNLRGERGYEEEGFYKNGQKDGIWRRFSLEGDLIAVENYRFGQKDGRNVYFNHLGELMREESWRAIDPGHPYDTVNVYDVNDPSKVVARQVVKLENASYKHGFWKYYDPARGTVEKTEEYVLDRIKTDPVVEDDLAPIAVSDGTTSAAAKTAEKKALPKPKEVLEFEKKNAGKKKIRVRDGSTGN